MLFLRIPGLLTPEELEAIDAVIASASFVDGKMTAGRGARNVKENLQLDKKSTEDGQKIEGTVVGAILRHPLVRSAVLPKRVLPPMFSKYEPGMSYGAHTDNPIMGRRVPVRTDAAATVFLSDPAAYEGGELVVSGDSGPVKVKLPRGDGVVYPTTGIHRVEEVRSGERLAAVTWIQSIIPDPAKRQIVHDLDLVYKLEVRKDSASAESQLLLKTYSNLVPMWAEV